MRLLMLPTVDIGNDSNKLIHHDVVDSSLQMQHEILALVAEELPLIHNDTNFPRKPTGSQPQMLSLGTVYCSVDQQNCRDALDGLSG